ITAARPILQKYSRVSQSVRPQRCHVENPDRVAPIAFKSARGLEPGQMGERALGCLKWGPGCPLLFRQYKRVSTQDYRDRRKDSSRCKLRDLFYFWCGLLLAWRGCRRRLLGWLRR